ncbi:MAG: GNAT family N-acetyltransferase [Roseibium sp.]
MACVHDRLTPLKAEQHSQAGNDELVIEIHKVRESGEINSVTDLVWRFFDHIRHRYPERLEDIDGYILSKDVAGQLADFATFFNPPAGECLLANMDGNPVGIVMMRPVSDSVAEMNRMFVTKATRGHGVGRKLGQNLIQAARDLGYSELILDAWDRHEEALPLYKTLGFQTYVDPDLAPKGMVADVVQMRMDL